MDRRNFIKTVGTAALAPAVFSGNTFADTGGKKPVVYVVHGTDEAKMLAAGMTRAGGFEAFVKKGGKATVKPNAAWVSRPEQGGNTSPKLVEACIRGCLAAGASEVVVPENPCDSAEKTFKVSGIAAAVQRAGGRMYALAGDRHFRQVSVPKGRVLKSAQVAIDVLDTQCLINMPVVKDHGGSVITCSMKNWMGSVADRRVWHRGELHQCIADLSTRVAPSLIIADATRIMINQGPRGPGDLKKPNLILIGTDPVAVDAYAATLLGLKPFDVPHVRIAHEMGVGCGELGRVEIVRIEA